MPDFRQRAEDALHHLLDFEAGPLADVKAELRKLTGAGAEHAGGGEPADAAPAEVPDAPAKAAKQDAGA